MSRLPPASPIDAAGQAPADSCNSPHANNIALSRQHTDRPDSSIGVFGDRDDPPPRVSPQPIDQLPTRPSLLLVGHGSAQYADAADGLLGHAAHLRRDGRFASVAVGLLNGAPSIATALTGLTGTVRVVPFFMEDGYFTRLAVPRALAATPHAATLQVCPPVGVHDRIAELIAQRVERWCRTADIRPSDLAVVLVGHGSARAPGRRMAAHRHGERLSDQGGFGSVHVAFLEEPPFVPETLAALRDRPVAVIGLFAGEGGHARDDLPAMLAAEAPHRDAPCADLGLIGNDPMMPEIILDQAQVGAVFGTAGGGPSG